MSGTRRRCAGPDGAGGLACRAAWSPRGGTAHRPGGRPDHDGPAFPRRCRQLRRPSPRVRGAAAMVARRPPAADAGAQLGAAARWRRLGAAHRPRRALRRRRTGDRDGCGGEPAPRHDHPEQPRPLHALPVRAAPCRGGRAGPAPSARRRAPAAAAERADHHHDRARGHRRPRRAGGFRDRPRRARQRSLPAGPLAAGRGDRPAAQPGLVAGRPEGGQPLGERDAARCRRTARASRRCWPAMWT